VSTFNLQLPDYTGSRRQARLSSTTSYDWINRFFQSTVEGMGEVVGITPSTTTINWRQDNPIAGVISDLAGFAIPYTGWFKVARAVPVIDRGMKAAGAIKNPLIAGALKEGIRFAPFEAGRVAASQVVGDKSLGDMTAEALFNLALAGGVGGVLEGLAAGGMRAAKLENLVPGVDLTAPIQLRTRYIQEILTKGQVTGDAAGEAARRLKELREIGLAEFLPKGTRYIGDLTGEVPKATTDNLNRLFRTDKTGSLVSSRLVPKHPDLSSAEDLQSVVGGLAPDYPDFMQFPRVVTFREAGKDLGATVRELERKVAAHRAKPETLQKFITDATNNSPKATKSSFLVEGTLVKAMDTVGDGWLMTKEAGDGLYVMAKKQRGVLGSPRATDQWLIFKTDAPGKFVPLSQKWANAQVAKLAWQRNAEVAADGGAIYNAATKYTSEVPIHNYMALERQPGGVAKLIDKLTPQGVRGTTAETVERAKDWMREYVAPARAQFGKNPRANYIHNFARMIYETAETLTQKFVFGPATVDPAKNWFVNSVRGFKPQIADDSIVGILGPNKLSEKEILELQSKVLGRGLIGDELEAAVASGEISRPVAEATKALEKLNEGIFADVNKAEVAVGQNPTKARTGHVGFTHRWEGNNRVVLRDQGNKAVGLVASANRRGAQRDAQALKEKMEAEGIPVRIAEEYDAAQTRSIPSDLVRFERTPSFVQPRQNMRGWKGDIEPLSREDLIHEFERGIRARMQYQAGLTVQDRIGPDLKQLLAEDPAAFRTLEARLADLAGIQGPLAQIQNRVLDKALGHILGENSASQIARFTNTAMFHLQLGALRAAFPAVNALTFVQTVTPEIAFTLGATERSLASAGYTYFAAGGTKGAIGSIGVLGPLQILKQSFREMGQTSAESMKLFTRAANERVLDPRFAEEFVGATSKTVKDWKAALGSPNGFFNWLRALSEWLPAQSERFSRTHAFATGVVTGRDYLKLSGDDLYRFSKEFTERTMFLYSTADRPRIFTTPAGSTFGLFKNWMMNYMYSMLEYAGEATRGNFAPLMWQTAGTFAGFSKLFTGDPAIQTAYEQFGEIGGNGVMFGLPAMLTGASLYSQTSSPLANPMRDSSMLFSIMMLDRVDHLSRAVGASFDRWRATGEHPGTDPKVRDALVRAFAPTTIYRIMAASQDATIRSLGSGYPLLNDVSPYDRLLYSLGFNPVVLDKGMAIADQLFQQREARRAAVQRLGEALKNAFEAGDNQMANTILRQAMVDGVDTSSVLRSAQARMEKTHADVFERNFTLEDIARFRTIMGR
jgi:hypothetical protein